MAERLIPLISGPLAGQSIKLDCPIEAGPTTLCFPLGKDGKSAARDSMPDKVAVYEKHETSYRFLRYEAGETTPPSVCDTPKPLWQYTTNELVRELTSRKTFGGFVVYLEDEIRDGKFGKEGDGALIAKGVSLHPDAVVQLLKQVLTVLESR